MPPSSAAKSTAPLAQSLRRALALFGREIVGIAEDFWKDGNWEKTPYHEPLNDDAVVEKRVEAFSAAPNAPKTAGNFWHAAPGEISEKMWGDGRVTPGDEYVTELLIKPLSLTKDMSLLDLSAGLGFRMRKTSHEFGVYINGREPDPEIAARGMTLSVHAGMGKHAAITAYDPLNFVENHKYDCVVARETLYRVTDKAKFVKAIMGCCKPEVQISFTDYIVNPETKDQPAILAWKAFETDAAPLSLVEMAELWAKSGINLRVHDDQTEYYKKEIRKGTLRLLHFLDSGIKPDANTKKSIDKRITTWAHRLAAFESGMRFYRFYGLKQ